MQCVIVKTVVNSKTSGIDAIGSRLKERNLVTKLRIVGKVGQDVANCVSLLVCRFGSDHPLKSDRINDDLSQDSAHRSALDWREREG